MVILDEKRGENWAVITIELEVKELLDMGKIDISPRWRAAAKQLATQCNFELPLVQIDADQRNYDAYYKSYSQFFVFYFGKES